MIQARAGDCRDVLPTLEAESFDCVVTSPPYFGLRDYGVVGQIGLEPTLDAYVEALCGVFNELWRVLKPTGTTWLNLGDSYTSGGRKSRDPGQSKIHPAFVGDRYADGLRPDTPDGLKPKDLIGVPWRVAFALQARGWWLRSAIVWNKPNPMPESVTDRPTSAYEMVFLLTKSATYFYDAAAIAEQFADERNGNPGAYKAAKGANNSRGDTGFLNNGAGWNADGASSSRNARNVWTIATQPYSGAHFATMPADLAERCIKAGCPEGGHVLDPFGGAGTTGLVADRLGRHATLIDLKPDYCRQAIDRCQADAPLLVEATLA